MLCVSKLSLAGNYFPVAGNRRFPAQFIAVRGRFLTYRTAGPASNIF